MPFSTYRNSSWLNLANIGLAFLVLIPLIALAFYNHPSAADDYCHIDTVFKYGWLDAMHYYYTGWSGRYFGVFLNHSNSLLFHSLIGFKLMPIVMYAGFIGSFYLLIKQLNSNKSFVLNLGIASFLFYLFILKLPSIVEAFFWTAAVVNYTVQNIFIILWIYALLKRHELKTKSKSVTGYNSLLLFLIFGINGGSENIVIAMLLLVSAVLVYSILFHRKFDYFYLTMFVWVIATTMFSLMAPGNAIRVAGNPQSRDFVFALTESIKYAPVLLKEWILSPALLISTVLWIFAIPTILKGKGRNINSYFNVNILFSILVGIGLVLSQIFSSYYGIGIYPADRIINCIYLYFLLSWFYNWGVFMHILDRNGLFSLNKIPQNSFILKPILFVVLLVNFYQSANPRLLYQEWIGGRGAAYNQEMNARRDVLTKEQNEVVYLKELENQPKTLYMEDMKSDPTHLWNRCIAGYFGNKAIYVGVPTPATGSK